MPADPGTQALELASQVSRIGFVDFTTSLVRNVYGTIVQSSIDQLRAYAELVREVSRGLPALTAEAIGASPAEQQARADDYVVNTLGFVDPAAAAPAPPDPIAALTPEDIERLTQHFNGITINVGAPPAPQSIDAVIATSATGDEIALADLRAFVLARITQRVTESYESLVTILRLGMQKILVTDGLIETKLTFHVDASDTQRRQSEAYDETATYGNLGGGLSLFGIIQLGGGIQSHGLSVTVVNETSTAALNVRADIIATVRINFRTDAFPAPPLP